MKKGGPPSKLKYGNKIDSVKVPWGKVEKDSKKKRVKRIWKVKGKSSQKIKLAYLLHNGSAS